MKRRVIVKIQAEVIMSPEVRITDFELFRILEIAVRILSILKTSHNFY